jgi:hypothetical protein
MVVTLSRASPLFPIKIPGGNATGLNAGVVGRAHPQTHRIKHITDKIADQYPGNTFFLLLCAFFRECCSQFIPGLSDSIPDIVPIKMQDSGTIVCAYSV